jgi:hypothetical protein
LLQSIYAIADTIGSWGKLPAGQRPALAEFVNCYAPANSPILFSTALSAFARCRAPVPDAIIARLGPPPGVTWAAAWRQVTEVTP